MVAACRGGSAVKQGDATRGCLSLSQYLARQYIDETDFVISLPNVVERFHIEIALGEMKH